jgi:transglutaminase-like putative cysteine protease
MIRPGPVIRHFGLPSMNPSLSLPLAIFLCTSFSLGIAAEPVRSAPGRPGIDSTYTITSTLQILKPYSVADMKDDFQDVRLIAEDADSCTVEITYYPLHQPSIGENPRWREEYAGMSEYLRSTPTENWDETMRRDLLAELRDAGIHPDRLTDKQLVEQVSRWAMRRSKGTSAFAIWTLHYPEGKATVFPPLRAAFDREKSKSSHTDEQLIAREALGRSMFYDKVHGSCTSSSVYLGTIFRALGIPTRIVFCVPPFDPNDAKQAAMFYDNIRHHRVRETVRSALDGMTGFVNHLFNEVFVGGRWVRLNYSTLGQPILDARYFGLLTHTFTCADLSQAPLAETWGMRYFRYREAQPKLTSVNPYRLIAVRDHFGARANIDNPVVPVNELRTATIIKLLRPDSTQIPSWVDRSNLAKLNVDLLIAFKEWIPGSHLQMRVFEKRVGQEFRLVAAGYPDLQARLHGLKLSQGNGSFQAYALKIDEADRKNVVGGVGYALQPINTNSNYIWQTAPDLQPIPLKD